MFLWQQGCVYLKLYANVSYHEKTVAFDGSYGYVVIITQTEKYDKTANFTDDFLRYPYMRLFILFGN